MSAQRLTLYLLQESISDFEDALDQTKTWKSIEMKQSANLDGRFYYQLPKQSTPSWTNYIQPALADQLTGIQSSSTSALLLLRVSGRIFALTFGYGRSLLNMAAIELQFGLRVALNSIDSRHISSLDKKNFEDLVVSTNTQTSKSAELRTFGVDTTRDILRGVAGTTKDGRISKRIAGRDSLIISSTEPIADLPATCERALAAFKDDSYKQEFGWIDDLQLLREKTLISKLDSQLVEHLRDGNQNGAHLAMPEVIDWEDIKHFTIAGTRDFAYEELDLDSYLEGLGSGAFSITLDNLKNRGVSVVYSRTETPDERWTLYRCIVAEERIDEQLYALIEGRWFAISSTLVSQVDDFVNTLPSANITFPAARPGEYESDYNARAARSSRGELLNLDAKLIRAAGATSDIEFCDLLSSSGDLIHIKRKARSSTLSHLFAQGAVSANTFAIDGEFRDHVRQVINEISDPLFKDKWLDIVPPASSTVNRSDYHVTFAVIARPKRTGNDWIPFFSKLNLMNQSKTLINLGFKVSITQIPIV